MRPLVCCLQRGERGQSPSTTDRVENGTRGVSSILKQATGPLRIYGRVDLEGSGSASQPHERFDVKGLRE